MRDYQYVRPADIEKESMRIIEAEMAERGIEVPPEDLTVVKRVIHTSADFDYGTNLKFTEGASRRIVQALREGNKVFITDTNMALSGISKPSLAKLDAKALCYMADPEIMKQAKEQGTTRAAASMRRGAAEYPEAVFVSGNAPTALITLSELIREGLRPSAVVAVPVGFVNVVESKEEIFGLCEEAGIPCIAAFGRKGGSNVAASICNALLYQAVDMVDPLKRGWQK